MVKDSGEWSSESQEGRFGRRVLKVRVRAPPSSEVRFDLVPIRNVLTS